MILQTRPTKYLFGLSSFFLFIFFVCSSPLTLCGCWLRPITESIDAEGGSLAWPKRAFAMRLGIKRTHFLRGGCFVKKGSPLFLNIQAKAWSPQPQEVLLAGGVHFFVIAVYFRENAAHFRC